MVKRFGDFEFDDHRRRLRENGRAVKLSGQAVDVLRLLLERPGDLITRQEIEAGRGPTRPSTFITVLTSSSAVSERSSATRARALDTLRLCQGRVIDSSNL